MDNSAMDTTNLSLLAELDAARAEIATLRAERASLMVAVAEGARRLLDLAQHNTSELEAAYQEIEQYAARWESEGSLTPAEIRVFVLAMAAYGAIAAEGGQQAFEVARAVRGAGR